MDSKPKNRDEQEIPFRLREIMRSRREMKTTLSNKSRRKAAQVTFQKTLEEEAKGAVSDIPVPKFKQKKRESDQAYVQRMEQEAQHVIFLSRNQPSCQPEAPVDSREKSERKKAFRKRRLDKIRQRKAEKAAERMEQQLLQDPVKFGDVALQPPELTARPRASKSVNQPGKKALLLKMCMSPTSGVVMQPPSTSLARQRILGAERERVVLAYRALKQRQRQQTDQLPR